MSNYNYCLECRFFLRDIDQQPCIICNEYNVPNKESMWESTDITPTHQEQIQDKYVCLNGSCTPTAFIPITQQEEDDDIHAQADADNQRQDEEEVAKYEEQARAEEEANTQAESDAAAAEAEQYC